MKKKKTQTKRPAGSQTLLRLATIGVALYAGVSILNLQIDVQARRKQLDELDLQCAEQAKINTEIEMQINAGDDVDYIVRMARERLDYVYPYETVFVNASGS